MENELFPNNRYAKSSLEERQRATNGLTKGQLQKVNEAQIAGQEFEQIPANRDNDFMINEHEKFIYHVRIKIPHYDAVTGKDLSEVATHKFNPNMWAQMQTSGVLDGKIVTILHDPTKVVMKDENGKFMPKPKAKII